MTAYSGTLEGTDGSKLVINNAVVVPAPAPPPPAPGPVDPIPAGANAVRIGTRTYPLAGVNPTTASNPAGAGFPGVRGRDQLILCRPPWSRSGTNRYGSEVPVVAGRLAGPVTVGGTGGIAIPTDGYVLSGHGAADAFLQSAFGLGVAVEVLRVDPPVPVPAPVGRTLGVYLMDGVGHISQIPDNVTQVRVAFLQRGGLVEWGGDSPARTAADLTAWRASRPGRQVLVSIGGAGGQVDVPAVPGVIAQVQRTFPVDGVDWDLEGGSMPVAQVVAASREMAREGWVTSFAPPGGPPVAVALQAAQQCQAAGLAVQLGQQLYDAEVSQSAALGALRRAVDVLGAPSVLVGMMVAADPRHWTVDQCAANVQAALSSWPALGGGFLWESSRDHTAEWCARVGAVLGL